jgi:hypothetical protein
MRSVLLPIHIAAAGIWLGCVVTEALFERALLGKGRAQELILVALHQRVDLIVEIPAFAAVLVTGGLMLAVADTLLGIKIAFGLLAIAANAYCVRLVFQRATAAKEDRWGDFARLDHLQHKFGVVVLFGILAALAVGICRFAYLH